MLLFDSFTRIYITCSNQLSSTPQKNKSRKFTSYGLEKPRLDEDCVTIYSFTSCCVALQYLTITDTFHRAEGHTTHDYAELLSAHPNSTYPERYSVVCSWLVAEGGLEPPSLPYEGSARKPTPLFRHFLWAGNQNRTDIPSMASWCTNHCAIPAF